MKQIIRSFTLVMLVLFAPLTQSMAQIKGTVTEASARQFRVAIPEFTVDSPEAQKYAEQIATIIRADLESTGLFELLDPSSFIETDLSVQLQPSFKDWRLIKAEALLVGEVQQLSTGELVVRFRLWDTGLEEQRMFPDANGNLTLKGRQFKVTPDNIRRLSHKVADNVYTSMTGDEGYFDTRIVFISESGPKTNRVKKLALMDQDGWNVEELTSGRNIVLTPRFSPTNQMITYMTYEAGRPQVYLFDIENDRSESLGQFSGMTFAPRFSPDGKSVIFSKEENGNSEIHIMDLSRRVTTQA